jgi:MFS family permease
MSLQQSTRNVAAIIACLTILQAALASLLFYVPLTLVANGAGAGAVGLVAAAFSAGFLAGAKLTLREIHTVGHVRAIAAFAAIAAVAAAGLSFSDSVLWWAACQALVGLSTAGLVMAGESWIADSAPARLRGAILGLYLVISKAGVIAGPFLVSAYPDGDLAALVLIVALFTACLIPVAATRRGIPRVKAEGGAGLRAVWRLAPAAVASSLVAGAMAGAVAQLYPVFAASLDPEAGSGLAATFNAAMVLGAALSLWPAGLISDRIERRLVIAALTGLGAICALILGLAGAMLPLWLTLLVAGLWGVGGLSFYGVAIAHAADRAGDEGAGPLMPALLIGWGVGSIAGPLLASLLMGVMGPGGLFVFAAIALGALCAMMVLRRTRREAVSDEEKGEFAPSNETVNSASVAAGYEPQGQA